MNISMLHGLNYFEILGVPRDAGLSQIRAAYSEVLTIIQEDQGCHPDFGEEREQVLSLVNRAYETLASQDKRHEYENSLRRLSALEHRLQPNETKVHTFENIEFPGAQSYPQHAYRQSLTEVSHSSLALRNNEAFTSADTTPNLALHAKQVVSTRKINAVPSKAMKKYGIQRSFWEGAALRIRGPKSIKEIMLLSACVGFVAFLSLSFVLFFLTA